MHSTARTHVRAALVAVLASLVLVAGASASGGGGAGIGSPSGTSPNPGSSGGAGIAAPAGGLAPTQSTTRTKGGKTPAPSTKLRGGRWLRRSIITEYWPAPEKWFTGALVNVPGLATKHRIDWLYSAMGVSMEGEGLGLDGRMYHINDLGDGGWVTASGRSTIASAGWAGGSPFWRAGEYWRNATGAVTFPLAAGGWSNGRGRRFVPLPGVTFAPGASLPLHFYQSIAVDPTVIPMGSKVYVPAYKHDGHGGWFLAQDTGGAIKGHHIDVYRPPPASPNIGGQYLTNQSMYVIPPARG